MLILLRAALRFLLATGVTLLIALAVFTGLLRLGLPYASTYKNQIQGWVSSYLGEPVEIGTMDLGWDGVRPHIRLDDVALTSDQQRGVKVSLEQIDLDFNLFESLFTGAMHINDVTIIGANLSLEYFGDSQFRITSNPFSENEQDGAASPTGSVDVSAWLFNARRVGLLNSRVKLLDRERGIDYQIDNLNIRAENDADLHQLRIDLQLPEQLGKTLEVGVDLTGRSDQLQLSSGRFYANITDVQLERWMDIWPERQVSAAGVTDLEVWGEWGGQRLQSLRGRIDGHHLAMIAGTTGTGDAGQLVYAGTGAADFSSFVSDFTWRRQGSGWRLEVDKLDYTHEGKANQIDGAWLSRSGDDSDAGLQINAQGDFLDVGALSRLLATFEHVPGAAAVARYASGAMMQGSLQDWRVDAQLPRGSASPRVDLSAKLNQLTINSYQRFPGVKRLSGQVDIADNVGQMILDSEDLVLQHRRVFPEPLALSKVAGVIDINLNDDNQLLRSAALKIQDASLTSLADVVVFREQGKLGYDINAVYELDDIAQARRYLPLGIMRTRLANWLSTAPKEGALKQGQLTVRGHAGEIPWRSDRGYFVAAFDLHDATLKFRPDWPALTNATGHMEVSGPSLNFNAVSGNIAAMDVSSIRGSIANFRRPLLTLKGEVAGPLQALLDFANEGPLQARLSPALAQTRGSGATTLGFATTIPLRPVKFRTAEEVFSVDGNLAFADNRLQFDRFDVDLRALSGDLRFDAAGIAMNGVSARFLGTRVSLQAETDQEGSSRRTDIGMSGLFHADRVLDHYALPGAEFVEGPAHWRVQLQVPHPDGEGKTRPVRLTAWSDLIGTAVNLPVPLAKGAGNARSFRLSTQFSRAATRRWNIKYDTLLGARLITASGGRLESVSMTLGQAQLRDNPPRGFRIDGDVNAASFDGWIRTINKLVDATARPGPPRELRPVYANIRADQMLVGNQLTGAATLRINTDDNHINASLASPHLRGNVRFPREHWNEARPVRSRISYVDGVFVQALSSPARAAGEGPIDPTTLPRIEAHISEVRLDSLVLNNLGIRTEPTSSGLAITALGFANDSSQLVGEGLWQLKDPQGLNPELTGQQTTQLDLKFQSDNLGRALAAMGHADAMSDGRGAMSVNLSWSGPAYKLDVASLDGKLAIRFRDGQLLQVEPGAAKLIGLFTLQEIPRRLSLDFRDVVKDGLDFGEINGNITIADGVATTHLLQLDGPIGVVDVSGVSDLTRQTLNQKVQVLPRVSAALPILGLLSGGASAGIGALLATPILKRLGIDFDRLGLTEYSVTGQWQDPQIIRLEPPKPPPDPSPSRD